MLYLPDPPNAYTARHLNCIACKEQFSVAEAFIATNQPNSNFQNGPVGGWRFPTAGGRLTTSLLRQEVPSRRSVEPPTRVRPHVDIGSFLLQPPHPDKAYVNCPRCGADNRNWLQIHSPRVLSRIDGMMLWCARFPGAVAAVLVAFVLGGIAAGLAFEPDPVTCLARCIPLGIITFLAGAVPVLLITNQWHEILDRHRLRRFLPQHAEATRLSPAVRTGLISLLFFALLVPLLGYFVIPRGLELAFGENELANRLSGSQTNSTTIPVTIPQTNRLLIWEIEMALLQPDIPDPVSDLLTRFLEQQEAIPLDAPVTVVQMAEVQNVLAELRVLKRFASQEQRDSLEKIITKLEIYVADNAIAGAIVTSPAPVAAPQALSKFLGLWVVMVGISGSVGMGLATAAVTDYAARTDKQVPRPIFHSVANMSRVVVWEAKRALAMHGDTRQIQWMGATRNQEGGIDLVGLERDLPYFDENGRVLDEPIPAQEYNIRTDRWGRIAQATIRDRRVRPTIGMPRFMVNIETGAPLDGDQPVAGGPGDTPHPGGEREIRV